MGLDNQDSTVYKRSNTIMTEIGQLEDSLRESLYRVELIEKKLDTKLLTLKDRGKLEHELELVKKVLKRNEDQLKNLRAENTKSFMLAGALVFICFLFYGFYSIITNTR